MNLNSKLFQVTALIATLSLAACSQKKIACKQGSTCVVAGSSTSDGVADAANATKVGIMNYDQIQTNFSSLMGFDRAPVGNATQQNITGLVTNNFLGPFGNSNNTGLRDALPISNRISEFNASNQMSIQKVAYNACDVGVDLDLMLYPVGSINTSQRKIIPNLQMTGLAELASQDAKTIYLNHLIDVLWMNGVSWAPSSDDALGVLLPLFQDLATGLPQNDQNAEKVILKTMCSVVLASTPAIAL